MICFKEVSNNNGCKLKRYRVNTSFIKNASIVVFSSFVYQISADELDYLVDLSLADLIDIEITVASNFVDTELESGSTVEVITKSQWRDYGATNLSEVISHQPSTMAFPVPGGGAAVAIRGYASNLSVRGIATVLDGIPLNDLRAGTALYDIQGNAISSLNRIEMIRGPGSALYGSDAFHGVISMRTYESDNENSSLLADVSSEGINTINANHTSVIDDGMRVHASVSLVDQAAQDIRFAYTVPSTTTELTSTRANSYDAYTGIFKLNLTHSETIKSSFGIYFKGHNSKEAVGAGQSLSPLGSIFLDKDKTDAVEDFKALRTSLEINLENDITFEGKGYYWSQDFETYTDTTTIPSFGVFLISLGNERKWGINLLLKQPSNDWNTQWAIGVDFNAGEIADERNQFAVSSENRTPFAEDVDARSGFERDVKGLVVSAKTKFLDDKLQIVYGGRLDKYSDFGNQTTPRCGAIYLPTKKSSIKLLYGEAFRAPITSELFGAGTLKGNPDLKPELIETTELIYIYQEDNWKLNLTYFKSDWNNGIILVPIVNPNFTSEYNNLGKNKSDGFEMSWRGKIDNWRWDFSASLVKSEAIVSIGNLDYAAFPEKIFNINFGYKYEDMDIYVTQRIHQDAAEGPINDSVPTPDALDNYYATDITFDWDITPLWNLQVGLRNAFDRDNFIPGVWNNENGILTLGRNFQAGFVWKM